MGIFVAHPRRLPACTSSSCRTTTDRHHHHHLPNYNAFVLLFIINCSVQPNLLRWHRPDVFVTGAAAAVDATAVPVPFDIHGVRTRTRRSGAGKPVTIHLAFQWLKSSIMCCERMEIILIGNQMNTECRFIHIVEGGRRDGALKKPCAPPTNGAAVSQKEKGAKSLLARSLAPSLPCHANREQSQSARKKILGGRAPWKI